MPDIIRNLSMFKLDFFFLITLLFIVLISIIIVSNIAAVVLTDLMLWSNTLIKMMQVIFKLTEQGTVFNSIYYSGC